MFSRSNLLALAMLALGSLLGYAAASGQLSFVKRAFARQPAAAPAGDQTGDCCGGPPRDAFDFTPAFFRDRCAESAIPAALRAKCGELDRALQVLPIKLEKVGRTAIYGSWFNFYLCEFQGRVILPTGTALPIRYDVGAERCDLRP